MYGQITPFAVSQADGVEETYCSDEIEVVLVDNSGPAPAAAARLDDGDSVKIIITMSCDPQTAAQLEESVKQSLLENAQVGHHCRGGSCGAPARDASTQL